MIIGAIISVASAAISVVKALSTIYLGIEGAKLIANLLTGLAKSLGLIEQNNPEELGDKALQAEDAGITPETCRTYEEYLQKVKEFEIDPEKSNKYTEEQKLLKGAELSAGAILNFAPNLPIQAFAEIVLKNSDFFTADWLKACTGVIKGGDDLATLTGYIVGTEKNTEKLDRATDMLVNLEKKLDSSISDDQAFRNVLRFERT